jgi:mRNA-degrading endonuclease RelE of RelBE toxin-antitoxin system
MFQIIFNPTSAAELAKLPKEKQLLLMGRFDDVPKDLATDNTAKYGRFAREGRHLYRLREGDYRIYFERAADGIVVHRILSKNTLKDFLFRSKLDAGEETELEKRPEFWKMIGDAGKK